jgi:hypothetical protein
MGSGIYFVSRSGFTKDAKDYCKERGIACSEEVGGRVNINRRRHIKKARNPINTRFGTLIYKYKL